MASVKQKMTKMKIDELTKDPNHPRQDSGDISSLSKSIVEEGLMSPVTVAITKDGKFQVLDGWKRVKALKELGATEVTCILYTGLTAAETAHKAYVLNEERQALNIIEKALHIKNMIDKFGYSYDTMEVKGYGSKAQICRLLRLLEGPPEVQEKIVSDELCFSHGFELSYVKDSKQAIKLAELVVKKKWSLNKLRAVIRELNLVGTIVSDSEEPDAITKPLVSGVYPKDPSNMAEFTDGSVGFICTNLPTFDAEASGYDAYLDNNKAVLSECGRVLVEGGVMAISVADIVDFKGPKGKAQHSEIKPMLPLFSPV